VLGRDADVGVQVVTSWRNVLVCEAAGAAERTTRFCHGSQGARQISSGSIPELVNISFQTLEEGLMPNVGTTPGWC
jgi:hypothetical protein